MEEAPSVNEKLWEFLLSGGIFMAFIVICSFVAVAVSIHRALTLRWTSIVPEFLREEWSRCELYFTRGKTSNLFTALRQSETPFGNIGRVALSSDFNSREEASDAVEATAPGTNRQTGKRDGCVGGGDYDCTSAGITGNCQRTG